MRLLLAMPGHHPGLRGGRLDAVTQPVRTRRRARQPTNLLSQTVDVRRPSGRNVDAVVIGPPDRLGDVLAQVTDRPLRPRSPGKKALNVVLLPEAHHVRRPGIGVLTERVERLSPRRQDCPSGGIGIAPFGPDREPVDVDRLVVGWPPELVIAGGPDLAQQRPRNSTTDGGLHVRSEP